MTNNLNKIIRKYIYSEGMAERTVPEVYSMVRQDSGEEFAHRLSDTIQAYRDREIGSKEFYEVVAKKINGISIFDLFKSRNKEQNIRNLAALADRVNSGKPFRILDVGCGTGLEAVFLAKNLGDNGMVTGIDNSPRMVEIAAERAKKYGLKNIEFSVDDIHNPKLSNKFNFVYSLNSITEGEEDYSDPFQGEAAYNYDLSCKLDTMSGLLEENGELVVGLTAHPPFNARPEDLKDIFETEKLIWLRLFKAQKLVDLDCSIIPHKGLNENYRGYLVISGKKKLINSPSFSPLS